MLHKLTLRNFRAFQKQSFDFSRINVFVGPNNSGKSSALSAINLIAQTIRSSQINGSPLQLNGEYEQLGTFYDVVNGGRANTAVGIDFIVDNFSTSLEFRYRKQRREIELSRFELKKRQESIFLYQTKKDSFDVRMMGQKFESLLPDVAKRRPLFDGFWPIERNWRLRLRHESPNSKITEETLKVLSKANEELWSADRDISRTFRDFDSLSPFRDPPQRTYLFTGESPKGVGRTGSQSVNLLVSDSSRRGKQSFGLTEQISHWLSVTDIANGLVVKTLTPRHFEVCVVGKDGKNHNICDVGFGCSQVLPVLAGGLNIFRGIGSSAQPTANPIFVVEEPEIHLHPNAQAALGSFFVNLAQNRGQIFIETHSDNLVLRLARHVAKGDLDAKDLRVFYVRDNAGKKSVTSMDVTAEGVFKPKWPGGFFPQRQSESLELARAASISKTTKQTQLEFKYPEEK